MIQVQAAIRVDRPPPSFLQVASCSAMAWAMARPAGATRSEAAIASGAADQSSLRGQDFIACSFPSVPRVTRDRLRNPASENGPI
jgi:hypothetical protein